MGRGLKNTEAALRLEGFRDEADAIQHIRKKANWSSYAKTLIKDAVKLADTKGVLDKLKILLYPSGLLPEHRAELKKIKKGIVWLEE